MQHLVPDLCCNEVAPAGSLGEFPRARPVGGLNRKVLPAASAAVSPAHTQHAMHTMDPESMLT